MLHSSWWNSQEKIHRLQHSSTEHVKNHIPHFFSSRKFQFIFFHHVFSGGVQNSVNMIRGPRDIMVLLGMAAMRGRSYRWFWLGCSVGSGWINPVIGSVGLGLTPRNTPLISRLVISHWSDHHWSELPGTLSHQQLHPQKYYSEWKPREKWWLEKDPFLLGI